MVKGICKQVILVKPRDDDTFEQAIFIVKNGTSVTEKELLRQAGAVGDARASRPGMGAALLYFFSGAAGMGLIWLLSVI